ncbi:MAG TPA: glycosyltransferase family 39 protein [Thermoanaerobaculia bacterium]|nr:glycosyltransferase family 39 protein [Thermoanaerobaculia bacterium]
MATVGSLIASVAAAVLPAIAMAFALRSWFGVRGGRLERLSLGIYLGTGTWALVHVIGLLAGGRRSVLLLFEFALAAACILLGARSRDVLHPRVPLEKPFSNAVGTASLAFSLLMTLLEFSVRANPFGGWDSWAIWTLHARFLHRGRTGAWVDMFTGNMGWSHPDYPLLVPASIARIWSITGDEGAAAPWLVALLFTLGLPLLVFVALRRIRGPLVGGLGAVAVVAMPRIARIGAEQYADVPLAGFFAATIALLALAYGDTRRRIGYLVLAGVTSSLAAWTKNEGTPFALAAIALPFLMAVRPTPAAPFRESAAVLAGAFPGLAALGGFRAFLAPPETVFGGTLDGLVGKCLDPARHLLVLEAARAELLEHYVPVFLLLALSVFVIGPVDRPHRWAAVPGLALVSAQAAVYYAIYIVTPLNQQWHVFHSIHRLVVHLAPSGILGILLLAADPGHRSRSAGPSTPP